MKNLNEMREFLANQLKRVANGELTPAHANASANLSGKMISSIKLELDYCKQAGATPCIDFLGKGNDSPRLIDHSSINPETGEITDAA